MTNVQVVKLDTLGAGAAEELFQQAFQRVLDNIADPNVPAKKKRQVVMTVTVTPNEDRDTGSVAIECDAKLVPVRPAGTVIFLGEVRGKNVAVENNPRQEDLFEGDDDDLSLVDQDQEEGQL